MGRHAELAGESGGNAYEFNGIPIRVRTRNMHMLSGDAAFRGNDESYVRVEDQNLSGNGADSETRTWDALDISYQMNGHPDIEDMELVIEPGTTLEFTQGASINFDSGTRMTIEGTEEEPITFTGFRKQRGWWRGVYVQTTDTENTIQHTTFEYGANDTSAGFRLGTGLRDDARALIRNCTFQHCDGYGYASGRNTTVENAENNTYTGNADGAARIKTTSIHDLSDTSDFTGNDDDLVHVDARTVRESRTGTNDVVWPGINAHYRMDGDHTIEDVDLKIDSGAHFKFTEGESQINFDSDSRFDIKGRLDEQPREGEDEVDLIDEPIIFEGVQAQRGWWRGIYIQTTSSENIMQYVTLRHAGSGRNGGLRIATARRDNARVTLTNCTFSQCDGYGVTAGRNTEFDMSSNTYTDNADGPIRLKAPQVHHLSRHSDFTGNDEDAIFVENRTIDPSRAETDQATWDITQVPYRFDDSEAYTVDDGMRIDIEEGTTFEMEEQTRMTFERGTTVTMMGQEENRILFTGAPAGDGGGIRSWDRVRIKTDDQLNTFEYVTFENGGNDTTGNFLVGTGTRDEGFARINNCIFRDSEGYGLVTGRDTTLEGMENNVYTGNEDGAARILAVHMHYLSDTSDFTGNDEDFVDVVNRTVQSSRTGSDEITWSAINVPYQFVNEDNSYDIENVRVNIEPGAEFQANRNIRLDFEEESSIRCIGTEDEPIMFTADEEGQEFDISGRWQGFYFRTTNGINRIEHTTVEYAGRGGTDEVPRGNIDIASGGSNAYLEVEDCTLRRSEGSGVYVGEGEGHNSDICTVNEFKDNDGGDCIVE